MKKHSSLVTIVMVLCLVFTNICFFPSVAQAKEITSVKQVKKLAKKQVKGAKIVEVETDYEKGSLVYSVDLLKGKKEYNLVFRASDAKLISYEWEMENRHVKKGKGKIISMNKAKKLARKQVKNGSITSIAQKRSNGIDVYKVKMKTSNKKYELKLHARTGVVLEYDWDLIIKTKKNNKQKKHDTDDTDDTNNIGEEYIQQISLEQAKTIALNDAGVFAEDVTYIKAKPDYEDGMMVYEIEFFTDEYRYEYEISAVIGIICDKEIKRNYTGSSNNSGNSGAYIGLEQAKEIALETVGSGRIVKAKFDMEDGQPIYEVEIVAGVWEYELEIHVVTGKVLKSEKEWMD